MVPLNFKKGCATLSLSLAFYSQKPTPCLLMRKHTISCNTTYSGLYSDSGVVLYSWAWTMMMSIQILTLRINLSEHMVAKTSIWLNQHKFKCNSITNEITNCFPNCENYCHCLLCCINSGLFPKANKAKLLFSWAFPSHTQFSYYDLLRASSGRWLNQ